MKTVSMILIMLITYCFSIGQTNRIQEVLIYSPSLENNLLGDSAKRYVSIYLPPGYYSNETRRYPVVYYLHGNRNSTSPRNISSLFGQPTLTLMDSLVEEGMAKEMIIVQADGRHRYGGCQYANSPVSGNWADFIAKDLIEHIDKNYRTLPKAESRGLVGSSMGGRGALDIAFKFPGIYGVVYAMFPGQMGFLKFPPNEYSYQGWRELILSQDPNPVKGSLNRLLGFAIAFSPNPDVQPYYADFPAVIDADSMKVNEEVMQRWAKFDPIELAKEDTDPLLKLNALYFDCGLSDRGLEAVRLFALILSNHNIPHIFEQYQGGHGDPGAKRMKNRVLPALSDNLVFQ